MNLNPIGLVCVLGLITMSSSCDITTTNTTDDGLTFDIEKYRIPYPKVPDLENLEIKADIGRDLFFLEIEGVSCASCHAPEFGFTMGEQQSVGKPHDLPPIKSPTSIGLAGSRFLLWSGAASGDVQNYPFNTVVDSNLTYNNWYGASAAVHQALFANTAHEQEFERDSVMENNPELMSKFKLAYPGVVEHRLCEEDDIAECLAAFQILHLNPDNSLIQQYLRKEIYLDNSVIHGWGVFDRACEGCHTAPYLGSDRFVRSNTPPFTNEFHDGSHKVNTGRMSMTGYPEDSLKFRVMRINSNIVDHGCWGYSCEEDNLTKFVQNHTKRGELTETELNDLMAFLQALKDEDLTKIR